VLQYAAAGDYQHEYIISGATGLSLNGTWTLQVTDNVKNRERASLIEWTMVVTSWVREATSSSQSAAATDLALLALFDLGSSDEEETDSLTIQAADELALMMLEQQRIDHIRARNWPGCGEGTRHPGLSSSCPTLTPRRLRQTRCGSANFGVRLRRELGSAVTSEAAERRV
jgi:hypothetical protein